MPSVRGAALAQLFAERQERRSVLRRGQEAIDRALESQARGRGHGPSSLQLDRLAVLTAASDRADADYRRVLMQVAHEIIAQAKASARPDR